MKQKTIISTALALALACGSAAFAQTMAPTMAAPTHVTAAKPATVAAPKAAKTVHVKHVVVKKKTFKKAVKAKAPVKPAA